MSVCTTTRKCPHRLRGNVLVLTLMLIAAMTPLAIAALERVNHQSQLAAALAQRALLDAEATRALTVATRNVGAGESAQAFSVGCPKQCDWHGARHVSSAASGVTVAYVAQRAAHTAVPRYFLITARAVHTNGGKVVAHALFDAHTDAFHFVQ